jgi:ATP-dependent protease ClpP protease subunit
MEIVPPMKQDKYANKAIRFVEKPTHYELLFTDDFNMPSSGEGGTPANTLMTDIVADLKAADKTKELHIFVSSFGGYVNCLNMLLQQVNQFKHKVGINLGTACSCGFMLLACCEEIYTAPYAMFMYHAMWTVSVGKVEEIKHKTDFEHKWWDMLVETSYVKDILTPEEIEKGKLTEVWLTGAELIERGAANDYAVYNARIIPTEITGFYEVNGEIFRREGNKYVKYVKEKPMKKNNENSFTYSMLLDLTCNGGK